MSIIRKDGGPESAGKLGLDQDIQALMKGLLESFVPGGRVNLSQRHQLSAEYTVRNSQ